VHILNAVVLRHYKCKSESIIFISKRELPKSFYVIAIDLCHVKNVSCDPCQVPALIDCSISNKPSYHDSASFHPVHHQSSSRKSLCYASTCPNTVAVGPKTGFTVVLVPVL
jgi:hypothetical protein